MPDNLFTPTQAVLHLTRRAHIAHTYQFPSSPWAGALGQHKVAALGSRVGSIPGRNNEQTNDPDHAFFKGGLSS